MSGKVRIALDAMGGDHGAAVVIPGAELSQQRHPDAEFLLFAPPAAPTIVEEEGARIEVTPVDAPEPLVGGSIDLGAIASEFLMLAIDPYPRKAGVVFEPPAKDADTDGPFAALAALKKKGIEPE